jgi:hypothetical protein
VANGHRYTKEQDNFIRDNYTNVSECVRKFNARFGTNITYSALRSHANRALGLTTGFRPWTDEMNDAIKKILLEHPYKQATEIFNARFGTKFTRKQVETHCVKAGISREHAKYLKLVDAVIKENIDKNYGEIRKIVNERVGANYACDTTICRRATNLGLSRPHRVWQKTDRRFINGKKVTRSEYARFIGNRWHRIEKELQPIALQIVRLQGEIASKEEILC